MGVGLLIIGLLLISSAIQNTQHELGQQVQTDLMGSDGFIAWAVAIMGIGALGIIAPLRTPSRWLLGLLAVVLVVRNGGVFQQAQLALQNASSAGPAPSVASPPITTGTTSSSSSGGSGGNLLGNIAGNVAGAAVTKAAPGIFAALGF